MGKTFSVSVQQNIPEEKVAYLICAGFEGGVGYWCQIVGYDKPENVRSAMGDEDGAIFRHVDYPLTGGAVRCVETEEEDPKELVLNGEAIERGLLLMAEKHPEHFKDFIEENEDATTGDVFIQLCLLGEVVYG